MAQSRLLTDSNSYFRLARSIHWKYEKDTPGNYRQEYKKLFKENAP